MNNTNRTISFVNIYKNFDKEGRVYFSARFEVNGVDVSARVYQFDKELFTLRKGKETGLAYLGSKFPLFVEFTALKRGESQIFTNIISMSAPSTDGMDDIEAMFKDADAQSTKQPEQPEQPEQTKAADATDEF